MARKEAWPSALKVCGGSAGFAVESDCALACPTELLPQPHTRAMETKGRRNSRVPFERRKCFTGFLLLASEAWEAATNARRKFTQAGHCNADGPRFVALRRSCQKIQQVAIAGMGVIEGCWAFVLPAILTVRPARQELRSAKSHGEQRQYGMDCCRWPGRGNICAADRNPSGRGAVHGESANCQPGAKHFQSALHAGGHHFSSFTICPDHLWADIRRRLHVADLRHCEIPKQRRQCGSRAGAGVWKHPD